MPEQPDKLEEFTKEFEMYYDPKGFLNRDVKDVTPSNAVFWVNISIVFIAIPIAMAIKKLIFDYQDANLDHIVMLTALTSTAVSESIRVVTFTLKTWEIIKDMDND